MRTKSFKDDTVCIITHLIGLIALYEACNLCIDSLGNTNAHLGAFSSWLLQILHFCLCQKGGIVNLTNQVFLIVSLIASMRTSLFSFGLDHDQRRSQFSSCFGGWLVLFLRGCLFSMASLLFNLIQFSFKWLVSLQYQQERSRLRDPFIPEASCGGLGFPKYSLPV